MSFKRFRGSWRWLRTQLRLRRSPSIATPIRAPRICRSSTARAAGLPIRGRKARTSSSSPATRGTLPWTWTKERRDEENAWAWGGGYGRTVEEANGNTHTVFGLAFLDSHKNIQWQVGYGWSTFWGPRDGVQPGLGYTAMIVQRPDIANGIPFPAVLPIVTLRYGQARVDATYIPNFGGGINHGSVFYVCGRVILD